MQYKSKTLQAIMSAASKQQQQGGYTAAEFAKMKSELETLKRKVEELTGERGDNPAIRAKSLSGAVTKAFGGIFGRDRSFA